MKPVPGPRIFCIPATDAPIVAVLRRGPSDWFHLGRWDVASGSLELGSWLHGTVYPQRDGRLLVATNRGTLQIRELADAGSTSVRSEHDLSRLTPDPTPPPAVARDW